MTAKKNGASKNAKPMRSAQPSGSDGSDNNPELSKQRREKLERDIMQIYAPNPEPREATIKPSPTDIAVITAVLSGGNGEKPDYTNNIIDTAIDLWHRCANALVYRERLKCLRDAVRELLFKDQEQKITQKVFLQRLLPKDSMERREELAQEGLERILTTFGWKYLEDGQDWSVNYQTDILEHNPDPVALSIMRAFMSQMNEGVTFELACAIAPFVLAWRKHVSSERIRGSMRHASAQIQDAPPRLPEDAQPDASETLATDADGATQAAGSADKGNSQE